MTAVSSVDKSLYKHVDSGTSYAQKLSCMMWNFANRNEVDRLEQLLLRHSNDIDIEYCPVKGQNTTALLIAAGKGYHKVVDLLIKYGCDTNVQNKNLESPLHRACGRGDTNMCLLLLQNGAIINVVDDGNMTPLHVLAATDYLETLQAIIQNSVPKYDLKDVGNRTAGDIAKTLGNTAMEKILKDEEHYHAMMDRLYLSKLVKKVIRCWSELTRNRKKSRLTKYHIDEKGNKVYNSNDNTEKSV